MFMSTVLKYSDSDFYTATVSTALWQTEDVSATQTKVTHQPLPPHVWPTTVISKVFKPAYFSVLNSTYLRAESLLSELSMMREKD